MSISDDLSTSCPYCHELVRNYLHNGVVSGAARGPSKFWRCDSFTYDGDPPPMLLMRAYFYSHSNGGRRECAGTGTQSLRTALGALIGGEIPLKRLARTRASRSVQR